MTFPFDEQWPYAKFNGDYIAFLNSMTKTERIAWRVRTDNERNNSMARGRPSKPTQAQQLLEALAFVSPGTGELEHWQSMVKLQDKMAITSNGQIAAGHPIVEELNLCPHLGKLEAALKRSGKTLVISETPSGQISIKGDKLRAIVNCMRPEDLPQPEPDPQLYPLDDRVKEAFKICNKLANENAERVHEASLLLEANQCTGTNGAAVLQVWHGVDLPPHMVLPKLFTQAVEKQSKPLVGFGFSWTQDNSRVASVTFYFEGGSWLKTQCYQDRWPDVESVLNQKSFPSDTLAGLFDAIEAVSDFSDDEWIVFGEGKVMSHADDGVGAQYEVKGLQGGKRFKGKLIKLVSPYAAKIDLTTYPDRAYFFGPEGLQVRGAIIGASSQITYRDPDISSAQQREDNNGVDINESE